MDSFPRLSNAVATEIAKKQNDNSDPEIMGTEIA
jgi:hypothetical protein